MIAATTATCVQCGMEREHWSGKGFRQDNATFCCQQCAEETGCRCEVQLRIARSLTKPIKAPRGRPGGFSGPKKRG